MKYFVNKHSRTLYHKTSFNNVRAVNFLSIKRKMF